jgi:hypothetical protein
MPRVRQMGDFNEADKKKKQKASYTFDLSFDFRRGFDSGYRA